MQPLILFDNDGTLSDSVPICLAATNRALADFGFPEVNLGEIAEGMRLETILRMMSHANIDDRPLGEQLAVAYYDYTLPLLDNTTLFPGVRELLERLLVEGYVMGVVSNNRSDMVKRVLEINEVADCFRLVIGEDNAEETKPGPGGLLQACRLLGFRPGDTYYIGDSRSDASAAAAAGVHGVGVLWNEHGLDDVRKMGFLSHIAEPADLQKILRSSVR